MSYRTLARLFLALPGSLSPQARDTSRGAKTRGGPGIEFRELYAREQAREQAAANPRTTRSWWFGRLRRRRDGCPRGPRGRWIEAHGGCLRCGARGKKRRSRRGHGAAGEAPGHLHDYGLRGRRRRGKAADVQAREEADGTRQHPRRRRGYHAELQIRGGVQRVRPATAATLFTRGRRRCSRPQPTRPRRRPTTQRP